MKSSLKFQKARLPGVYSHFHLTECKSISSALFLHVSHFLTVNAPSTTNTHNFLFLSILLYTYFTREVTAINGYDVTKFLSHSFGNPFWCLFYIARTALGFSLLTHQSNNTFFFNYFDFLSRSFIFSRGCFISLRRNELYPL